MVACPPRMPFGLSWGLMYGADSTTPSSTIAAPLQPSGGWHGDGGIGSFTIRAVSLANPLVPSPLKVRSTCQSLPLMLFCGSPAEALLTSVPGTSTLPSRYLVVPSRSHATRKVCRLSGGSSGLGSPQFHVWNKACAWASVVSGVVSIGLAAGLGEGVAPALGVVVGDGEGDGAAASSPPGTARPFDVAVGFGVAAGLAFAEGAGVALVDGVGAEIAAGAARPSPPPPPGR